MHTWRYLPHRQCEREGERKRETDRHTHRETERQIERKRKGAEANMVIK